MNPRLILLAAGLLPAACQPAIERVSSTVENPWQVRCTSTLPVQSINTMVL